MAPPAGRYNCLMQNTLAFNPSRDDATNPTAMRRRMMTPQQWQAQAASISRAMSSNATTRIQKDRLALNAMNQSITPTHFSTAPCTFGQLATLSALLGEIPVFTHCTIIPHDRATSTLNAAAVFPKQVIDAGSFDVADTNQSPAHALAQAVDTAEGDVTLAPQGTPFQQTVWRALCHIGPGQVMSYGSLAAAIGKPRATRAVAAACGANPLPWVIPCHRVVAADGSLHGFGLGLPLKASMLQTEISREAASLSAS